MPAARCGACERGNPHTGWGFGQGSGGVNSACVSEKPEDERHSRFTRCLFNSGGNASLVIMGDLWGPTPPHTSKKTPWKQNTNSYTCPKFLWRVESKNKSEIVWLDLYHCPQPWVGKSLENGWMDLSLNVDHYHMKASVLRTSSTRHH